MKEDLNIFSQEKLAVYQKYRGDNNRLSGADANVLTDSDWSQMTQLLQQLQQLQNRKLSEEYSVRVIQEFEKLVPDDNLRKEFMEYALKGI